MNPFSLLKRQLWNILVFIFATFILNRSCGEFYNIAWGTGVAIGQFSLMWLLLFSVFVLFCCLLLGFTGIVLWKPAVVARPFAMFISFRKKSGSARWLLALLIFIFPVYFLQYTAGGVIFQGMYIRSLIWAVTVLLFAGLISGDDLLIGWREFLAALILTSSEFIIAFEFIDVTNYPFSLGWSEGNRLWDYSLLFGSGLYLYPADKGIPVLLDFGRQLVGGLPFLIPGINIGVERFWVALTFIIPYLLLGLATFRASRKNKQEWLFAVLWVFLFLKQGPIHPPLVLSAALTALGWGAPLWLGIPLVAGAAHFAFASRTTWMFAPAIWIVMLEFSGASFTKKETIKWAWIRSTILGFAGILGLYLIRYLLQPLQMLFQSKVADPVAAVPSVVESAYTAQPTLLDTAINLVTIQPLLWYRLLPNSTYKSGILVALVLAVAPLMILLAYLLFKKIWQVSFLQKTALILPLLVFLGIGLVASAKIGGGGDLHNMDMFLITLMFAGALAWYNGGREWLLDGKTLPAVLKLVVVIFFIVPALAALRELYSYNLGEEAPRLMILADRPDEKSLDMRPTRKAVDVALATIREEVELAKVKGDVLFIDQRQLLTFGYIEDVPLIPEYEKKVLMNEALSANGNYFRAFYADLAAQRFELIISEPLRVPERGMEYQFGEENDAWVKYVAIPILCYYEPKTTLSEVGAQMLIPKDEIENCAELLP
jgi:hypothetical protein